MKTTRNLIAVLLALLLVVSLNVTALAEDSGSAGSITVTNPEIGKTYSLYKLFAGEGSDGTVAYKFADTNTAMYNLLTAEGSPFELIKGDSVYYVYQKAGTDDAAVRSWLQTNKGELIEAAGTAVKTYTAGNTDKTVTFSGLDFGYYLVQPGTGALVIIDTNNTDITVHDKNPLKPGKLDKNTDEVAVAVGETVRYTVKFEALNYEITAGGENKDATDNTYNRVIVDYLVTDTYTGLGTWTVSSVKYYPGLTMESTVAGSGTDITASAIVNTGTAGKTLVTIPWAELNADGSYSPLYAGSGLVVIEYTMTANKDILGNDHVAPNVAALDYLTEPSPAGETKPSFDPSNPYSEEKPYQPNTPLTPPTDPENPGDPWKYVNKDDEKVYTCGINIDKVDGADTSKKLSGAQFVLYRLKAGTTEDTAENREYYQWADNKVNWSTFENATRKTADNSIAAVGNVEFDGLDASAAGITYYLSEVLAPEGYNPRKAPVPVIISCTEADDGSVTFSAKVDGTAATLIAVPAKDATVKTIVSAAIANTKGQELPSTGGAGTVAMIAVGSFVAVLTAILLITKKRVYNQGL